jgi:hypothetical protein
MATRLFAIRISQFLIKVRPEVLTNILWGDIMRRKAGRGVRHHEKYGRREDEAIVKRFLYGLLVAALAFAVASGCAKKEGEEKPPAAEEVKVVGVVYLIGAPDSSGVEVKVEAAGLSTTTDAKGAFVLRGLTEGVWDVTFSKPGYPTKTVSVTVEPGKLTIDIGKIEMEPGGSISGVVTLEGATDFKGIKVTAVAPDGSTYTATTDSEGKFSVTDLKPGDYTISAEMEGYEKKATDVTVEGGKEATVELTLPRIKLAGLKETVLYFKFDETKGDKVTDSSGRNNHGTVIGNPVWKKGKFGNAFEFDGNTWIEVPDSDSLNFTDVISIEVWAICYSGGPDGNMNRRLLQKGGDDQQWRLLNEWGNFRFEVGSYPELDIPQFSKDVWHHVVAVYDGANLIIYIDGEEAGRKAVSGPIPTATGAKLFIGTKHETAPPGDRWYGMMDELRIINKALTPQEVKELYKTPR